MDSQSKIEMAKRAIDFIGNGHDDDIAIVKTQLDLLRKHIDEVEKSLPDRRAEHAATKKAIADRKAAA